MNLSPPTLAVRLGAIQPPALTSQRESRTQPLSSGSGCSKWTRDLAGYLSCEQGAWSVCSEVAGNLVSVTVNFYFHKASILYLYNSEFLLQYIWK
jgi:hypothetical protein